MKRYVIFLMAGVSITSYLHACLTTFINDRPSRIIIYNKADKTLVIMRKNERRRFGNQYKHAHFAVYMQQSNKPIFSRVYTCKQHTCENSGNIQLKLSDLENNSGSSHLFLVRKNAPYVSMVQELPMVQKCSVCTQ